jgi:UDP-N-acetylmuramate: L-alanyl-gamma-D-glutamyl-meso-diaminopimelate ligase
MSETLECSGIETRSGFDAGNLDPAPDLVVIGNVCRRDNPEARAAIDRGLRYASFPAVMEELFLASRPTYTVAGSHGKTTTTSLLSFLLYDQNRNPGFLVGGIPRDFGASHRLGDGRSPFVIEGDEYDSAFFEKTPKFWRYRPDVAILTSVEHDHIDIYPDAESYEAAFIEFVRRMPQEGLLVAWAGSPAVRRIAAHAPCRVSYYALEHEDTGDVLPVWCAAPVAARGGVQPFELFVGGTFCGRVMSPLAGHHNIRNALAAMAAAAEGAGLSASDAVTSLQRFSGVRRRQELIGVADGVRVYDDFAHHPSAVAETLRALRSLHPEGRLIAAFEPRSATACRRLHQDAYPSAFRSADLSLIAPVGRNEIPQQERLDVDELAQAIRETGGQAEAPRDIRRVVSRIAREAQPGDTVVLMSKGQFGGAYDDVLVALAERRLPPLAEASP